jgi:hypothetical protein
MIDGDKSLKTMMISAPNNGNTIDQKTEISASGSNVYVTWWTNKTGTRLDSVNPDVSKDIITTNRFPAIDSINVSRGNNALLLTREFDKNSAKYCI